MFQIGKTIISEEILNKEFVCDLSKCKGACCVDGEAGAPLEESEAEILHDIYDRVKPYLREEGIEALERDGLYTRNEEGELETTLIDDKYCAYVIYDEKGISKCGIEQAYNDGKIDWKKPISCHLYPIRIKEYSAFAAVNYHKWHVCDDACSLGESLKVPMYAFVKEALIRKYGDQWYRDLEAVALNQTD